MGGLVEGRVLTNSYQLIAALANAGGGHRGKERGRGLETALQINDWSESKAL